MTTYRKKLIEVALPLEAINIASAREKSIRHGHPSTLHLWWARRPLAACRAVIFSSLVDDPDDPNAPPEFVAACRELPKGKNASGVDRQGNSADTPRQRLFDFIETLVQWESTTDEKVLNTARQLIRLATGGNPPPLLDPFAGGGSIPLEAQRLGLEAHASDLNPVAVMINKALIEIPPKFANQPPVNPRDRKKVGGTEQWKGAAGLAADVRYYGEWMRQKAWERIGHLYPDYNGETVIAWLWARTVACPNPACGAQMPLITSFELSKKKGKAAWVEPQIDTQNRKVSFTIKTGIGTPPEPPKVSRGAKFRCLVCGEIAPDQHLKDEGMAGRMGAQLMAVVTEGKNGRNYHPPTLKQETIAAQTTPTWKPAGELPEDPRNVWCKIYGFIEFADLFTPRQLIALTTFSDLVPKARAQIQQDSQVSNLPNDPTPLRNGGIGPLAYAEAITVYLSFAVDRLAEKCNSLSSWQNTADKVRGVFARQAIPMVWDYADVNPFSSSTGNFYDNVEWVAEVIDVLSPLPGSYSADQVNAVLLDINNQAIISTDPPYYDNIGYADLSDFFYIWLRHNLQNVYPHIFETMLAPKGPELIASPYRFKGDKNQANRHFEVGLQQTFSLIQAKALPGYPTSIFYAFKQAETEHDNHGGSLTISSTGWETMLEGLIKAGFTIEATWPMRTERTGRTLSIGTNALASSVILVCCPRHENAPITSRRDFVNALRRELPAALREMQSGNIAPVDLAQASIGPGMAIYSRYSQVLEPDGSRLTVRAALQLINQVLDEYLAEAEGELDGDTRFAVAWFEQYAFNTGEFGIADVLARAKNTSVDGLGNAGILHAAAGKVRLLTWEEMDPGWDPATDKRATVWEATHHLIERLNVHGEQGAALLLAKMPPDLAAAARQLAYRLYSICERKGWAEQAREYNALVLSWSSSQEQAVQLKQSYQQSSLFG